MSLLSQALSTLPLIILICVAFTSILFLKVLLRYGHHCQSTQTLAVKHRRYPEGPLCLFDHNVVGPHQCGKSDLTLNSASLSVSAVYPQFVTPVLLLVPLDYHSLVEMGYLFSSFAALFPVELSKSIDCHKENHRRTLCKPVVQVGIRESACFKSSYLLFIFFFQNFHV